MATHKTFLIKKLNKESGVIETYKTVVDYQDAYRLRSTIWNVIVDRKGNAYVCRHVSAGVAEYLHRTLAGVGLEDGWMVEHKNGNTLDNRKENLRKRKISAHSKAGTEYAKKKVNLGMGRVS